jgi:hypothetical protein
MRLHQHHMPNISKAHHIVGNNIRSEGKKKKAMMTTNLIMKE